MYNHIEKDNNKIAFVICVNDELSYEECLFYLDRLRVPEGMRVEIFAIREADSIYQAYNYVLQQSDAKYKIYMHQDVFLIEQDILVRLVEMFQSNASIGMIGLIGGTQVPRDKRFYRSWDVGNVLACSDKKAFWNDLGKEASKVWAIDGMFMATQYDVPWREELGGWDFYDISQSMEFIKNDYEVWVLEQKVPYSIHDCGYLNLTAYDVRLQKFLECYGDAFPNYDEAMEVYPTVYKEKYNLMMELKEEMKAIFLCGQEQEIYKALEKTWDERFVDTEFVLLKNILDILMCEQVAGIEDGFLKELTSFSEAREKYRKVKYLLWREQFAKEQDDELLKTSLSKIALLKIKEHSLWKEFCDISRKC